MDFFDNAINKAKDVFDFAYRKTDEIVTVQKQKFDIATLKRKRNEDFEKLGKIYFKLISDNEIEDTETLILVEEIKQKNEKIKELRAEIEAAKEIEDDEI